jgi:hypothetical protein
MHDAGLTKVDPSRLGIARPGEAPDPNPRRRPFAPKGGAVPFRCTEAREGSQMEPESDPSARRITMDADTRAAAEPRRPGELVCADPGSAVLLWQAYGISGFRRCPRPGDADGGDRGDAGLRHADRCAQTLRLPRTGMKNCAATSFPVPVMLIALMLVAMRCC